MPVVFSNDGITTLGANITSSATTITVADGSVFPSLSGSEYFYVTLEDVSSPTTLEIVKVTARSGNALTVVRAQDNTSASAFDSGDRCELRVCAALLTDINTLLTGEVTTDKIADDNVTLAKIANMATASLLGRNTSGTGDPEVLSAATVRSIINVANGSTANQTDAHLLARANHTGTQAQSTIVDLTTDLAAKVATADIKNNLTSTDTDKPLSAAQGKALNDAKQANLTFGISDTNSVKIDGSASYQEFVRFTATGIEGRSKTEFLGDLNVEDGADVTDTYAVTQAGALMDSEVDSLMGIKTLDVPVSTTITSYAKTFLDDTSASAVRTTLDLQDTDIKSYYEANSNTNAFTDALLSKLNSIEDSATADQSNSEIKTAYEANSDTNPFTDALLSKLNAIEDSATADQTNSQIEAAYNSQVNQATNSELVDATSSSIRRFSPADIKTVVDNHGSTYTHPNHSGDVTSSGDGATTIAAGAVTLSKMANMAENSFLGRGYVGTGSPQVLSAATARSVLNHTNNKSTCVFAKYFSNATTKLLDSSTYNIEIWWDSSQYQIKYKLTDTSWSYIDGSHLHIQGTGSTTDSATITAWANDISANHSIFQYISNNNTGSGAVANSTFNVDDAYGSSDRFTIIKESHASGFAAYHGIVFIGASSSVAIQLWEITG